MTSTWCTYRIKQYSWEYNSARTHSHYKIMSVLRGYKNLIIDQYTPPSEQAHHQSEDIDSPSVQSLNWGKLEQVH